jgi:adenine-specific DNA-methyltransferase
VTSHPCQSPVELVERLVLALSQPGDFVLDSVVGTGSSMIAALRHGRRAAGAEILEDDVVLARRRIAALHEGRLRLRPMGRPVYDPIRAGNSLMKTPGQQEADETQLRPIREDRAAFELP